MGRLIGGILAGIVAAFVTVWVIDLIGHTIYPVPTGLDIYDKAAVAAFIASLPVGAQVFVAFAWFAGALDGGLVAALIGRRRWTVWLIAALVACAGVLNVLMIPHPLLLQIAAVAAPLLGGLVASWIVRTNGIAPA
jgi:hypothetical protein